MITDAARHKLLVLTGQCFENTGELILQSGSFSFQNFIEIFTDQEVGSARRHVRMCRGEGRRDPFAISTTGIQNDLGLGWITAPVVGGWNHCRCAGDVSGQWNDQHLQMAEELDSTPAETQLSSFPRDFSTDLLDFSRRSLP